MAKGLHPRMECAFRSRNQEKSRILRMVHFPNELVAGFILIDVKSKEAIEWAMRMSNPQGNGEGQIELWQVF